MALVSGEVVIQLVENIKKNKEHIKQHNDTLKGQLSALRSSFLDDGYSIIKEHVTKTEKQIYDSFPAFEALLSKMTEYGCILIKAKKALEHENVR